MPGGAPGTGERVTNVSPLCAARSTSLTLRCSQARPREERIEKKSPGFYKPGRYRVCARGPHVCDREREYAQHVGSTQDRAFAQ